MSQSIDKINTILTQIDDFAEMLKVELVKPSNIDSKSIFKHDINTLINIAEKELNDLKTVYRKKEDINVIKKALAITHTMMAISLITDECL